MHVPKCGGCSFANSIVSAIGAERPLYGHDRLLFGDFDEFASIASPIRDTIYLGGKPSGERDFVSMHGGLSTLRSWFPSGRLATVMREPRVRLMSHFRFWRGIPTEALRPWGAFAERIGKSHGGFEEFLGHRDLASQTDNLFARFLLSPHPDIPQHDFIRPARYGDLYRESLERLAEFDFVDLLENPRLERNVSRWLGREFRLRRDNQTNPHSGIPLDARQEFDRRAIERMDGLTAIDRRLWLAFAVRSGDFGDPRVASESLVGRYVRREAERGGAALSSSPDQLHALATPL